MTMPASLQHQGGKILKHPLLAAALLEQERLVARMGARVHIDQHRQHR
jgi:hypothetical protein